TVDVAALPRSAALQRQDAALQRRCQLDGGDDYELLFSAPPQQANAVRAAAQAAGVPVTPIGRVDAEPGLRLREADGRVANALARSFDHFAMTAAAPALPRG
ncbi:MAG: thiamine-phosphate kinase, partial [Rubrivivax sp.]